MKRSLLLLAAVLPWPPSAVAQPGVGEARRLVAAWYVRYLGREPDPGAEGWVQQVLEGQAHRTILAGILSSDEYYKRAGGTPARFIRQLHEDLLGRRPTPRELDYWMARTPLRDRQDVATDILVRYPRDWQDDEGWRERYDYRRPRVRYR